MWDQIQTYLAEAILTIIGGVISVALGIGVKHLVAYLKSHLSASNLALLESWAAKAYTWVEQEYGELEGSEKLKKAAEYVASVLSKLGITFTTDEIKAAIQEAWYELEGYLKKVTEIDAAASENSTQVTA